MSASQPRGGIVSSSSAAMACIGMALMLVPPAHADRVRLKSGDVVSGEVLRIEGDDLIMDPDFTDEIDIELADIESVETTRRMRIQYDDGSEIEGYLVIDPDGRIRLSDTPTPAPTPDGAPVSPAPPVIELEELYSMEQAKPYFNYTGHIDFGLNAATGNTESTNLTVSGLLAPSFGLNHVRVKGQLNRQTSDGDTTASNWRIDGTYEYEFRPRWFAGALNSYEQDRLQDLDLRTTAGVGLSHAIFEPDPTLLKVGLYPGYVIEDYADDDDDRDYAALLWKLDFAQDLWTSDVNLYHDHTVIAGLSESGVIALTTTGLKFELIGDLKLLMELQFDWNSEPAEDAEETDQRYLVKLSYEFEGDQERWFK